MRDCWLCNIGGYDFFFQDRRPLIVTVGMALLLMLYAGISIYGNSGEFKGVTFTAQSAWAILVVASVMLMLSCFALWKKRKNPPPPPDPDEEAAKAKAELDAMYFREHGKYPEEADEGKEEKNGMGQVQTVNKNQFMKGSMKKF